MQGVLLLVSAALATPLVFYQGPPARPRLLRRLERRLDAPEMAAMWRLSGVPSRSTQRQILRQIGTPQAHFVPALFLNQSGRVDAERADAILHARRFTPCPDEEAVIAQLGFIDTIQEAAELLVALSAASACFQTLPTRTDGDDPFAARAWELANQQPALAEAVSALPRPEGLSGLEIIAAPWQTVYLDGYPMQAPMRYGDEADICWTAHALSGAAVTGASVHVIATADPRWDLESHAARGVIDGLAVLHRGHGEPEALTAWMMHYQYLEEGPFYLVDDRLPRRTIWRWDAAQGAFIALP